MARFSNANNREAFEKKEKRIMVVKEFPIKNERACFLIPAIFFIVYF
jgi:hypothetical protein